jgi:signal transduction histidine kinase/CheY-like chemotaxis protein
VWGGGLGGLFAWAPQGWERHGSAPINDLDVGDGGLAAVGDRGLWVRRGEHTTRVPGSFRAVAWHQGQPWVGGEEGLFVVDGEQLQARSAEEVSYLAARGEALWAAHHDRLWEVGTDRATELPGSARSLAVDREGQLWVGLLGRGLARVRVSPLHRLDVPAPAVVAEHPEGGLLVSSGCEGVVWVQGEQRTQWLDGACVRALAVVDDEVWIAHDTAVSRWTDEGIEHHTDAGAGGFVLAIDPEGHFVGARDGLFELGAETLGTRVMSGPFPVVIRADDGTLWAGGPGRVGRLREGEWRWWTGVDGLPPAQVRDLVVRGDEVWVATYGGGLARLRGDEVATVTRAQGLHENVVSRMLVDDRGVAWLNGNRGVSRVTMSELDAAADRRSAARVRLWRVGEGNGGSQPAGALIDGIAWLPQLEYLTGFPTADLRASEVAPSVRVLEASLDGHELLPDRKEPLPPGPGRLIVRYTAGALAEPELVRFQWRFDEQPWVDLGKRREAVWESVPPGPTRLQLRAANADGRWGEPTELHFVKRPRLTQTPWFRLCLLLLLAGGAYALHRVRGAALARRNRELEGFIEGKRAAEEALRRSELHYRSVFEAARDGLIVVSEEGRVAQLNPAAEEMLGGTEVVGKAWAERVRAGEDAWVEVVRDDGTSFRGSVDELSDARGRRLISVSDVSDLLAAEERARLRDVGMAQAQRLEAIGRLAAGVAHDVNNLLGGLVGVSEALAVEVSELRAPGEALALLDELDQCIERGARLTQQLMAFGRNKPLAATRLEVGEQLTKVERLLRQACQEATLVLDRGGDLWVHIDPAQFDVSVLNLVLNACDAGARTVRVELYREAGFVVVAVVDDGEGMSEEAMARALDPFYTTRADGTGLGLPSVHGFASQAGGELRLVSTPGLGTRAELVLPSVDAPTPLPVDRVDDAPEVLKVLVVDDDRAVLRAMQRMLSKAGMAVTAASSGEEALDLTIEGFDAVVTDVRMPGISGPELAERLWSHRADLPVLFVSGYADAPDALPGKVVAKPFRTADLLDALQEVVAAARHDQPDNVS